MWPPVGEQWAAQRAIKCGLATSLGLGIGIAIEAGDGRRRGIALWPEQRKKTVPQIAFVGIVVEHVNNFVCPSAH